MKREELSEVDEDEDEDGDEDEDEDDELDEEDDDLDEITGIVLVERLSSVEAWEMYRLVNQDTGLPIASIAIDTPQDGAQVVDYAVWRVEDVEEPGSTGSVDRTFDHGVPAAEWDDLAREKVLRQVLYRYEQDLGVEQDKADFRFAAPDGGADEEDEEDEEGQEDEG